MTGVVGVAVKISGEFAGYAVGHEQINPTLHSLFIKENPPLRKRYSHFTSQKRIILLI